MTPQLHDVPETMLWTLHNRASEAQHRTWFIDEDALRIYQAIDYDYERSFGKAEPSHAVRSAAFDEHVRAFLRDHPDGVVVNLGEGLEKQRFRVEGEEALWISVDLPDAIQIRESFIEPDERHLHIPASALDPRWMEAVPDGRPLFITAQGLFMYFDEPSVRRLIVEIAQRFQTATLMFDVIPKWLSKRTTAKSGWQKTATYATPPMPWGLDRSEAVKTLSQWVPGAGVQTVPWPRFPRGVGRWLFPIVVRLPFFGDKSPAMMRIDFKGKG